MCILLCLTNFYTHQRLFTKILPDGTLICINKYEHFFLQLNGQDINKKDYTFHARLNLNLKPEPITKKKDKIKHYAFLSQAKTVSKPPPAPALSR